jgi:hyperosmotically inducible protein
MRLMVSGVGDHDGMVEAGTSIARPMRLGQLAQGLLSGRVEALHMKLSVIAAVTMLAAGPVAVPAFAQASSATQTKPTDQELSSLIATKIANDKSLAPDAIKVKVEDGVVTLSGMVAKDADKARAEEVARVPGVVRIENKLTSREKATDKVKGTAGTVGEKTKAGAEKTKDATKSGAEKTKDATKKGAEKTKDVLSKTGEVITDGWITSRIKTKFMADEVMRASSIDVDTDNHVVTLTGAVPNAAARTKAIALAKEVEGVNRVVDKLQVADKTPK